MKDKKEKIKIPKGYLRNPELNKYADIVLFPNKLKRVNAILKTAGIPKI